MKCAKCHEPIYQEKDGRWFHRTGFVDSPFCGVGKLGAGNLPAMTPNVAEPEGKVGQ